MQVFKTFLKVMRKRLHVSMIYIIIFIAICIAMTATAEDTKGFENQRLDISVTDLDDTTASHALKEFIAGNHNIVEIGTDKDEMMDALYYQSADIILTINEGYSERLANGETDDLLYDYRVPGTYTAAFFDMQIEQYIRTVSAYITGGMPVDEAAQRTDELLAAEIDAEIYSESESDTSAQAEGPGFYFQYLAYILIAVLLSGLCPTLLVMTSKEIRNRTNCSCVSVAKQTAQLVLGTVIFSAAVYMLLLIVATIMYGDFVFTRAGALSALNGLVYLLFTTLLTLMLAVIAPNERVVNMIANTFSLGMSFLCGVFVPQNLLSGTVLNIGRFLPAYWYIKANNMLSGLCGEVFHAKEFCVCICIQLAFTAALFALTLLAAKIRRKSRTV